MRRRAYLVACVLLLVAGSSSADELMMVRAQRPFPEAMNDLQQAIRDHGYKIVRVQRVDIGLTSSGYKTAEYRVVFFGKAAEVRALTRRHPELMPYLPLKVTIFAEGDSTLLVTNNPSVFESFFRDDTLKVYFRRWERDVRSIFEQYARPY